MPIVLLERTDDREEIEAAAQALQGRADRRTPAMRRAMADVMRAGVAAVAGDLLERGLRDGDHVLVRSAIPELSPGAIVPVVKADEKPPIEQLSDEIETVFTQGARYAVSFAPRFDLVDDRAVQWARERAGRFLSDLDARALANSREAVAWGIENGRTVADTARYLRSTLYLPDRGMNAVENYFNGLLDRVEKGDDLAEAARHEASGRALSPRQFLDAQNIDTLVDRYADNWIKYTAKTTARTMTIESSNAGLRTGWDQAADAGLFDPATATLVWYATNDDLVCPECAALNGTEVAFADGTWDVSLGVVEWPPAHPNCRCTLVLVTGRRGAT